MKKIAIITAMQEEADYIINFYSLKEVKKLVNISIYENKNIVLVLSWIWKIQASIATTYLLENYKIKKIINIWIVWNLRWDNFNVWDVFIVDKIIQHDIYLPFEWLHLDYAKKIIEVTHDIYIDKKFEFDVYHESICLTWDQFIDDIEKVTNLWELYNADIVEMEAFAIASVAREYDMLDKCIFIKSISDWADSNAKESQMNNLDYAMKNSLEILKFII